MQQEAAEAERAERRARRRKLVEDEEEDTLKPNLQDLLPLFVHEKPTRSATEAAQDEYDGMQTRESREGVAESLSDAEKWLLSDDLLECEELRRYKQAPTTLQAALATSTSCPHLFHAPECPRPPLHIRDLITRDKDVLDRRAYLKEQKLLDFAKLMAPPKPELLPGELTPPPTPRLEPPLYRIKRSLSLAAPERAASTVEMWRRHAAYLASMATSPRKYRKMRDTVHFANLEAPPTWFIKTRPPEFDATIRRYEIERDALDPDVQNFVEPERLSDDQWIGEKELIEKIAEDANRRNWIESESEEEEESEAESTDEETQEASKETVGERLARKEAAKEARKEEKRIAKEERRLAKARAKDEERKRLRAEREAKAASKKRTPKKKKVTLDAEAMRSPPDGPASPLTPSPKRGRSRSQSPKRPGTASSRPSTAGSARMTPRWEQHEDDRGQTYYFCAETGETSWSKPDNWKLQEQEDVLGTPEL